MCIGAKFFSSSAVIAAALLCIAIPTSAATLNIEFDVRTRSDKNIATSQRYKDIVVFVIDRSGSMDESAKEVGCPLESRDKVLKRMLEERMSAIASTRPEAEIYTFPFNSRIRGPIGPYSAKDSRKVLVDIGGTGGQTLLYDTMARAVNFSEEMIAKDPSIRVWMYIYTDGANYCTSKTWTEEYIDKTLLFGETKRSRRVKVMYPGNDDETAEQFARDYVGKIKDYAVNGKMALESGCWLGAGDPPKMIANKRKDDYKLELRTDGAELKNPATEPSQTVKADLLLPIPERCVKDLQRLNAVVQFEVDGRRVQGPMTLNPGTRMAKINLPANLPARHFQGKLSIVDLPDVWKDVSISSPEPVVLDFAAPGALSFVSIEPRESLLYRKVGDSVDFSAKAIEGALVYWSVDGKQEAEGRFSYKFGSLGLHTVTAVAKKSGFIDAVATIKIQVIDATVSISAQPAKPVTGDKENFLAKTVSKAEGYSWIVDGQVAGDRSQTLSGYVFDKSGKHVVKVRASFGHGIFGECEQNIDVAARPFVKIVGPYSGQEFDFGTPIKAVASVEGEFDTIDWQVSGDAADAKSSSVDRKEHVSNPVEFKSLKGGKYKLVAVVKGSAGEPLKSDPVSFTIKREDVMVRIDKPLSGASVEVGQDLEMKASVKGQSVKEVKWTVTCKGKELFSVKKPVQGGISSCVFKPDVALGNGAVLMVKAEDADDAETSSDVDVETSFFAALDIVSAKVGNRDANGLQASFGEQVALEASCKGGVDPSKVEWVEEIAGKEKVIGNGPKVNTPKVAPDNSSLVSTKYFARAKLPDGSTIFSGKVTVFFVCDDIIAKIVLPKGKDGLPQNSFKPGEELHLCLEAEGGRLTDVEWDFGDGTKAKGDNVKHAYSDEKKHKISAKGKCVKCGKIFSTSVEVSTACPDLELVIVLPKGEDGVTRKDFGLKEKINLELSAKNGEAADVVWDFGDGGTAKGAVASHVYGKYGSYSIVASAKCKRCGKPFMSSREEIKVKVFDPKAKFEIKEKGSYYTIGSKLHLESKSSGDVEDLVWTVDGVELLEYRGKPEAVVQAPKKPCEIVIGLQVVGPSGTEPSYAEREVRIRYGWWAVVILTLLALLAIGILAWLFLNNGPAGWMAKVYCYEAFDLSVEGGRLKEQRKCDNGDDVCIGKYWSLWDKRATLPLKRLAALNSRIEKFFRLCNVEAAIKVTEDEVGRPVIEHQALALNSQVKDLNGSVYRQYRAGKPWPKGKEPKFMRFVIVKTSLAHRYLILFFIFALCVIYAAFLAALRYAI